MRVCECVSVGVRGCEVSGASCTMTDVWDNKWTMPWAISKMSMGGDLNGVSAETLIITHVNCWDDDCSGASISLSLAVFPVISWSFKVMYAFHSVVWCNWMMVRVHVVCCESHTNKSNHVTAGLLFCTQAETQQIWFVPGNNCST